MTTEDSYVDGLEKNLLALSERNQRLRDALEEVNCNGEYDWCMCLECPPCISRRALRPDDHKRIVKALTDDD